MFSQYDTVQIDHEGDKDDQQIGVIVEVNGTRYLVQFPEGGGGWYEASELRKV